MITLAELRRKLDALSASGVHDDAPIIVEGHEVEEGRHGRFVQASVTDVTTETRCEEENEPASVYLTIEEIAIDD